uniref:Protein kinase domain-containing protein n=1 Tax=Meloidogyne incognita TaxID=6306 RepID=A0A914KQJ3_MELIC
MKSKLVAILMALMALYAEVVFGKALPIREIYSDLPPECKTLNLETVESIPTVITVNGKQYNIKGQIQHGATSRVFHAFEQHDNSPKRCMALKVVDLEKIEHKQRNQATNEAKILGELNQKKVERIPKLFEIEQHPTNKTISMVMELAHHDLFDEITPHMGQGKHEWVRNTFKEILQAINPLHKMGFVHGDLKPENMAYFRAPRVINDQHFPTKDDPLVLKVIDFGGVMKKQDLSKACGEIVTGTVMYMSPEQVAWCAAHDEEEFLARRKQFPLSTKSDTWSAGVILYQMLHGKSPYYWITKKYEHLDEEERGEKADAELRQTIFDGKKPIEFDEKYQDLPLLEIVKRCLARNPDDRPEIEQLLHEMDKLGHRVEQLEGKIEKLEEEAEDLREEKEEREEEKERDEEEKKDEEEEDEKYEEEREEEEHRLAEERKQKQAQENARLQQEARFRYEQEMARRRQAQQANLQFFWNNFLGGMNNGYGFFPLRNQFQNNQVGQNFYPNNNNNFAPPRMPQLFTPPPLNVFPPQTMSPIPPPKPVQTQQQAYPQTQKFIFPGLMEHLKEIHAIRASEK